MKKSSLLAMAIFGMSCVAHSQTIVSGGLMDFGIQNPDSTLYFTSTNSYSTSNRAAIMFADFRQSFDIELSMKCNTWGTEQVFLCKEGRGGEKFADLSVGFDPMWQKIFVEVKQESGELSRIVAGDKVMMGQWYHVKVRADYDGQREVTDLSLSVAGPDNNWAETKASYKGVALPYNVTYWTVGRGFPGGFPNSLQVRDGYLAGVKISGTGFARRPGQNPLFTDRFTGDPACTVVGDSIYAYVGEDMASPGGWFNMPHWLCYSSADMVNWKAHGPVLRAADFPSANPGGAWAAQVVKSGNKYYFYVTLDEKGTGKHMIDVAVGDSPLGPFKPARKDGTPLITDDMTPDSYRPNADIDPTVLFDDEGTPWMAWGNGDCYMVRLKKNMIELDGEIRKVPMRNYSEGPWLFKRGNLYYNVYAADAPGVQPEQIAYSFAPSLEGPWTYGGLITGPAKYGFTIHPSVVEFKGKWYFFYHDGSYMKDGEPGGDCRRHVCVEYLNFNEDGSIQPIVLTEAGIAR